MAKVRARMLSRRDALQAAGLGLAAGGLSALGAGAVPRAAASEGPLSFERVLDLTHPLDEAFPGYSGAQQFFRVQKRAFATNGLNLFEIRFDEHTGTHIDAPLHFSADGASVDEIAPRDLVAPLCVLDIAARAEDDPDAEATPADVRAWIAAHGPLPPGACVALHTGWGRHVGTPAFHNRDAQGRRRHPGFHAETAQMLLEETAAASLAIDTLSLDLGLSRSYPVHLAWLPAGRFGIECMANLDQAPPAGATVFIGAPKHRGGTGGPARVLALI